VPDCPWASVQAAEQYTPEQLADQVIAQMTTSEKLGIVDLGSANGYENIDTGVPSLCIPALTLQDGPAGLAFGDTGVTQLPAPIALAATFQPLLATDYGQVLGAEAAGQGIDVVQAPDLNLVRVPESGRSFETLGEDPLLASVLGADEVQGIQAKGTLSEIKHYTGYTQETDRLSLDQDVSTRALDEVYDEPFQAAVAQDGAAAVMCAFGEINETPTCQDQALLSELKGLSGFDGFVRSDLGAVSDPVAAFGAGLDMIKPSASAALAAAVADGQLPISRLNDAVQRVLSEEFAFGLIDKPRTGAIGDVVVTPGDTALALQVAEQSIVLLKDASAVLPLAPGSSGPSVAVIGTDASTGAATTGGGSAEVNAPFVVTPLQALENELGPARVAYDPATPSALPTVLFGSSSSAPPASTCAAAEPPTPGTTPPSSSTTSSTTSIATTTTLGAASTTTTTTAPVTTTQASTTSSTLPASTIATTTTLGGSSSTTTTTLGGSSSTTTTTAPVTTTQASTTSSTLPRTSTTMPAITVTPEDDTATGPLSGPGWNTATTSFTAPATGTYALWLTSDGDAFLSANGESMLSASGLQNELTTSTTLQLQAGTTVNFDLSWFSHVENQPVVSIDDVNDAIASAVSAAQQASVPIVFACDAESEGSDRQNLDLPGYQNALISAVAAANPQTVVVLNTGGPVLTPWLSRVAAVLEAWYPGEEDGNAIAAVLDGQVDPTGRLPLTFPASEGGQPFSSTSSWPGNAGVVSFDSGLDVGYRGYLATGTPMSFPFGYGLSYTSFSISNLRLVPVSGGYDATVSVSNVGADAGQDTIEAYLSFPSGSGEPPEQLAAFASADLAPGTTATATMVLPRRAFEADLSGSLAPLPGDYVLSVGTSANSLPLNTVLAAPPAVGVAPTGGTPTGASSGGSAGKAGSGAASALTTNVGR
jgi:beta-glucosidase